MSHSKNPKTVSQTATPSYGADMYILTWYDNGVGEICCDAKNVMTIAAYFEHLQLEYCVSDRTGKLSQDKFGIGGYRFWITGSFSETQRQDSKSHSPQ
jgi:hypothetical protein